MINFIGKAQGSFEHMFETVKDELQPSAGLVLGLRQTDGALFGCLSKGMTAAELAWLRAYVVRLLDDSIDELMYTSETGEDESPA